jgi:hypothetical protein
MSPLCQLEMTLTGGLWGDGLATDDEELSRLEESTAREAVRPLMLRSRPYKRAVGHPVGLYRSVLEGREQGGLPWVLT